MKATASGSPRKRNHLRRPRLRKRVGGRARVLAGLITVTAMALFAGLQLFAASASATSPLNVFVGYMDTHSVGSSSNQPNPWPYTDSSSFVGTPCPGYPNDTTCWDSGAIRLDNPGSTDVTGVSVSVNIGGSTYSLWSNMTVKAGGMLVLTETGSSQNSTNFDGTDYPPNAYNGGNTASCANSGAIPTVKVTIGGVATTYLDNGQVLNGGGVDAGHCLNGSFVSSRMDESHPWVQIGSSSPVAPSAPQSLAAKGGDGSVSLTWAAPANNGGASISGYNIYRSTTPGGEGTTPVKTGVTTTSFTDTGLTNGTTYYYTVAAVNSAGTSPQSGEASATPAGVTATVPTAPQSLAATAGQGSVKLSWSIPSSNGGSPITGYNVYRSTTPGGEGNTPFATGVTTTSYTDSTVTNGTTYYYTVAAVNTVGPSPQSNEASATPQATAPSAPTGLVASGGDGKVTLSWTVPNSDGGSGITGYSVYRSTTPGGEGTTVFASAVSNTYTDTAVTNGTTYYYKVAAVNAKGTSPQSGEANATPKPAATVPSAPQGLGATAGNGSVSLSWSAPASNGGAAVLSYNVYRSTSAGGEGTTPVATGVTGTSFIDSGRTDGTTYYYTVAAVNSVGTGPQSSETNATPQATAPSAPLGLKATGADSSVNLSWSLPATDGGSPITSYNVYRSTTPGGEGTTPLATGVTTTSYTDPTATNGTTYYYTVAAVNGIGTSPQSSEANATPQPAPTVPSAPQGLTATGGNGSVNLSWSAPTSNGGAPVTSYNVYRSTTAGGEGNTPFKTGVTSTSLTDTGLTNGTTYYYTVAAVNSVGPSLQSSEANATPQATAPSAPLGLKTSGGNGSVSLSWSAPASNGGSPVTSYNVYRSTAAGGEGTTPFATNVTTTSYVDSTVTNGTTYYYTVAAVNGAGTSPQSSEASATPKVPSAAYVGRVGSLTTSTTRTTTSVTAGGSGVAAGDTIVVSLLLSSTRQLTTAVKATDTAGNSYVTARDVNDGSAGDRTLVLVSVGAKALPAGGSITLTYPSSAETHVTVDDFSGVTGIDTSAGATGTTAAFSSGAAVTTQANDLLIGVVGAESAKSPTWASGWTKLPTLTISTDFLDTAYQMASAAGSYTAGGTTSYQWMAGLVALKTS